MLLVELLDTEVEGISCLPSWVVDCRSLQRRWEQREVLQQLLLSRSRLRWVEVGDLRVVLTGEVGQQAIGTRANGRQRRARHIGCDEGHLHWVAAVLDGGKETRQVALAQTESKAVDTEPVEDRNRRSEVRRRRRDVLCGRDLHIRQFAAGLEGVVRCLGDS